MLPLVCCEWMKTYKQEEYKPVLVHGFQEWWSMSDLRSVVFGPHIVRSSPVRMKAVCVLIRPMEVESEVGVVR